MSVKSEILRLFEEADGAEFSGQSIAQLIGVSRTAVWKAINSLKKDGYCIEASTNKGYRLIKQGDCLSADSIRNFLPDELKNSAIRVYETVDSTNTLAKKLAAAGAESGTVIVAEEQTAGRGRRGNSFFSPRKTGLYMSVIIRPESEFVEIPLYTVCAANAVCAAIETVSDEKPQIKWVNDIFLKGKKICGILTEATIDFESHLIDSVIIGIGINLLTSDFPDEISKTAGSLGTGGRARVCAKVIKQLFSALSNDQETNIAQYKQRSLVLGKKVSFTRGGETLEATAEDINPNGHLEVVLDNGEKLSLDSGEISIKL